jgi:hypothetical protein
VVSAPCPTNINRTLKLEKGGRFGAFLILLDSSSFNTSTIVILRAFRRQGFRRFRFFLELLSTGYSSLSIVFRDLGGVHLIAGIVGGCVNMKVQRFFLMGIVVLDTNMSGSMVIHQETKKLLV